MAEIIKYQKNNVYVIEYDDIDKDLVNEYVWHVVEKKINDNLYIPIYICTDITIGYKERIHLMLSNHIMGNVPNGYDYWDHINRNILDNKRLNFRPTTHKQNTCNRNYNCNNKISSFRGVSLLNKKFRSYIKVDYKQIHLGVFNTEKEAALEYDKAARIYFGEFAVLNFPDNKVQ